MTQATVIFFILTHAVLIIDFAPSQQVLTGTEFPGSIWKSKDTWTSQRLHIQLCLKMLDRVHVWQATSTAERGRN